MLKKKTIKEMPKEYRKPQTFEKISFDHPALKGKNHYANEILIKEYLAEQLLIWAKIDGICLDTVSDKVDMPIRKVLALFRGSVGSIDFYELLHAITKFGYDVRICVRPIAEFKSGKILVEV